MNAVTGQPCGIFQENRFMTDLRTGAWPRRPLAPSTLVTSSTNAGAAGGIALKHFGKDDTIGFIGCGAIAARPAPPRRCSRTSRASATRPTARTRPLPRRCPRSSACRSPLCRRRRRCAAPAGRHLHSDPGSTNLRREELAQAARDHHLLGLATSRRSRRSLPTSSRRRSMFSDSRNRRPRSASSGRRSPTAR